jgi:hypothetical protein
MRSGGWIRLTGCWIRFDEVDADLARIIAEYRRNYRLASLAKNH